MLFAVLAFAACRRGSTPAPATSSSAVVGQVTQPADAGPERLPEDPVEGKKATAQWKQHLIEEERERKQWFDRQHRSEHEAVLVAIEKARARYGNAKTEARMKQAEAAFSASLPALRKQIDEIDPGRQSSNLLDDYSWLLDTLAGSYPRARRASLDAGTDASAALAAEIERRLKKARDLLAEGEGEGEEHGREHD